MRNICVLVLGRAWLPLRFSGLGVPWLSVRIERSSQYTHLNTATSQTQFDAPLILLTFELLHGLIVERPGGTRAALFVLVLHGCVCGVCVSGCYRLAGPGLRFLCLRSGGVCCPGCRLAPGSGGLSDAVLLGMGLVVACGWAAVSVEMCSKYVFWGGLSNAFFPDASVVFGFLQTFWNNVFLPRACRSHPRAFQCMQQRHPPPEPLSARPRASIQTRSDTMYH